MASQAFWARVDVPQWAELAAQPELSAASVTCVPCVFCLAGTHSVSDSTPPCGSLVCVLGTYLCALWACQGCAVWARTVLTVQALCSPQPTQWQMEGARRVGAGSRASGAHGGGACLVMHLQTPLPGGHGGRWAGRYCLWGLPLCQAACYGLLTFPSAPCPHPPALRVLSSTDTSVCLQPPPSPAPVEWEICISPVGHQQLGLSPAGPLHAPCPEHGAVGLGRHCGVLVHIALSAEAEQGVAAGRVLPVGHVSCQWLLAQLP